MSTTGPGAASSRNLRNVDVSRGIRAAALELEDYVINAQQTTFRYLFITSASLKERPRCCNQKTNSENLVCLRDTVRRDQAESIKFVEEICF
jgi:hypothetical protein